MNKRQSKQQDLAVEAIVQLARETQTLDGCKIYPPYQVLQLLKRPPFRYYTVERVVELTGLESRSVRAILQRLHSDNKICRTLSKYRNTQQYYYDDARN